MSKGRAESDKRKSMTLSPGLATQLGEVRSMLVTSITAKKRKLEGDNANEPKPKLPANSDLSKKRVVEMSLNLMAVYSVDDIEHEFEALVSVHLRYDPTPTYEDTTTVIYDGTNIPDSKLPDNAAALVGKPVSYYPDWEPEISMLNAREAEEIEHIPGGVDESKKKYKKGEKMEKKTISKHYEATFIKSLNLKDYPFDSQELEIVIVGDNETYLTHMMDRDDNNNPVTGTTPNETHRAEGDAHPHLHLKAVMDDDVLTEWEVLEWKETSDMPVKFGVPVPVVSAYSFKEMLHKSSGEEFTTTRVEFKVYVNRRWGPIFMSVIFPMGILCAASMVAFSMEITQNQGNRFGMLFTIVLTIVANTIVLDANLPKLPYLTWVDTLLLEFTLFVYWVIGETAAVMPTAYGINGSGNVAAADQYDNVGFWISLSIFALINLQALISAMFLLARRSMRSRRIERQARKSMALEEKRNNQWKDVVDVPVSKWYLSHLNDDDHHRMNKRWGKVGEDEELSNIQVVGSGDEDKS